VGRDGVTGPVLLAVAHGSRDEAAQDSVRALAGRVQALAPDVTVRVGFVQHGPPAIADALAAAGPGTVVVPLLLSGGYHLNVDIAAAARAAGAQVAAPLGPDDRLAEALADRLADRLGRALDGELNGRPGDGLADPSAAWPPGPYSGSSLRGSRAGRPVTVLAAAGSADPRALADVQRQARLLAGRLGTPVLPAYASAAEPSLASALAALRAAAAQPVAIATYLLSPGYFYDRFRRFDQAKPGTRPDPYRQADGGPDQGRPGGPGLENGGCWVSAPLGSHPAVADLVLERYRAAAAAC
jgi:sirohydrochlorin ferrochelatase